MLKDDNIVELSRMRMNIRCEFIFYLRQLNYNNNIQQATHQHQTTFKMFKNIAKSAFNQFTKKCVYSIAQKANKDLYDLLEVTKDADEKEIKKAYYKLAQKYHPDKNSAANAKQKFAEIQNAYEVLSDNNKRRTYDQTGFTGEGQAGFNGQDPSQQDMFNSFRGFNQGSQSGMGFQDIFSSMFGGGAQTRGGFSHQEQPSVMSMSISFEQSVKGVTKNVEYSKQHICGTCKGSKCKPGTEPEKCRTCNGSGSQTMKQGPFVMKIACNSCGGQGSKIKHHCGTCRGVGVSSTVMKQQIKIPRGIANGSTIRMKGKGNFDSQLIIKITVKSSNKFKREGNNSRSDIEVSAIDAVLGGTKQVTTIQGKTVSVQIKAGTQPNQQVILPKQGFYFTNSNSKGDHILDVKIVIPRTISAEQKVLYEKIRDGSK